ncbi:carbon-nitrogen hydrolase family protein [Arthrobacter sp. RAF14]|uniref:carbon-nitrogen hydrolase family protein n=1 Tax=Arthrobacter sp. RAF14 TaxID=3233051 RepID=UPI003F934BB3
MIRPELTVAAVQFAAVTGDVAANVQQTLSSARTALEHGARLIVFPELSLTGYDLGLLKDSEYWFVPEDVRLDLVRTLAGNTGATIVVGAPVISEGGKNIASVMLSGEGPDVIAPKTHLHGAEPTVAEPGQGPTVIDCGGWRVALAVCYDTAFAEHAASARSQGADIYAASVLYTEGEEEVLAERMADRARHNGLWSIAANLGGYPLGTRSAGGSGIWSPAGQPIVAATGRDAELVIGTVTSPADR